jgi:arylsulfatase A
MLLTHCPFTPTPDSKGWDPKSEGSKTYKGDPKHFGAMVHHMDKVVGRIIAKLEEHKLRENTIVIFTGDNGTDRPIITSLNGKKIKFGKGQMNDNGTRVPLIVSYPGKIQSGIVSDVLVDFSDIFPTICEVSGITIPTDLDIDGVSFWSTLQGKPGRVKPWTYVWWEGKVLARTRTHMIRRMKTKGKIEFIDYSAPYGPKALTIDQLEGKAKASYETLLGVISKLDQARPTELFESYKKEKK